MMLSWFSFLRFSISVIKVSRACELSFIFLMATFLPSQKPFRTVPWPPAPMPILRPCMMYYHWLSCLIWNLTHLVVIRLFSGCFVIVHTIFIRNCSTSWQDIHLTESLLIIFKIDDGRGTQFGNILVSFSSTWENISRVFSWFQPLKCMFVSMCLCSVSW